MTLVTTLSRRAFRRVLGQRAPVVDGELQVDGTDGPLTIRRDRWHVPHIDATTPADAWFGLGFVQGQDRAFQITAFSHVASGRLAELTGRDAVEVDRLMRRLGLARTAREAMAAQPPERLAMLDAFARGLTAGMHDGSTRPAVEFTLLRSSPPTFSGTDVAAIMRLFAFTLAANWQDELARLQVLAGDGPDALARYDLRAGDELPTTSGAPESQRASRALAGLEFDLDQLRRWVPVGGASNNWTLAGHRTASGLPIVANDPHLPPSLPTFWYLAHVTCPDWSFAGALLPGTPGMAAGHNGHAAWGTTAGHCDETDLFLEQVHRDDRGTWQFRDGEQWVDAEVRHETIHVRGGRTITEEVVVTPRGPIVGPALDGAPEALSLAATWLDAARLDGFTVLPEARTVDDFHEAFRHWPGMSLNVVWGDADGHIAWQLAGSLPTRQSGDGTLPLPGWDPDVGWNGRVPYEAMPRLDDPESGLIATANNTPVPHDADGPFLGADHLEGYRLAAITETLSEHDAWTVASTLAAQRDTRSIPWRYAQPLLVAEERPKDPAAAIGWGMLAGWDGDVAADSPAASVYELTMASLRRQILRRIVPQAADHLLGQAPLPGLIDAALGGLRGTAHTIRTLEDPRATLGSRADTFDPALAVQSALAEAIRTLRERGDHVDDWQWGRVRPLHLHHPVSQAAPPLAAIFDRGPFPLGGDTHTIPQASVVPGDPLADPLGIVSLRMAVDLGDLEASRFVLPGGQSGDPSSPHYDDQLALFLAGEAIPIPWADAEVARATRHTLRINAAG